MTTGKLTLVTSRQPAHLGKTYRLTASGLEKRTAGQMINGSFEVLAFADVQGLAQVLGQVSTSQAISASLPKNGSLQGTLVTKAEKVNHHGALARSKDDFVLAAGQPGVLILDYDPPAGVVPLDREQLWEALLEVAPGLASAGVIWWCSGSSLIYHGQDQIQGLVGQRIYVLVQDLADTERFGEVLFKRLWLAGHGRVEISKAGSLLSRCLFDQAMHQPARLDFGGAVCEAPLEQRRGQPVILSEGGFLDTRAALPGLTDVDQARFEDMLEAAKLKAAPEAEKIKALWQSERVPALVERLVKAGVSTDQATERAERTLASAQRGVLLGDFEVQLDSGETVTVGAILDDRARFHGHLTKDPLEPGYQNGKTCGKLYLFGSSPILTSRAHGGKTFRLMRQPSRLYLQKGGKAGLVDQIIDRLGHEPDLFLKGGIPVRIENGEARPLFKHALSHTIQSRIALFSRNDKGQDIPVDLPGDVVEMVMALLGVN
ncbi:MAG: hypothetical protein D3M94_14010 [Rhodocyclales bacterium GT-UBC]|nr:MAG: hypothetical protein D3M94_14010 [Rhodocyclales bacterium GT-UBC]